MWDSMEPPDGDDIDPEFVHFRPPAFAEYGSDCYVMT
jgi:hypothetical protein